MEVYFHKTNLNLVLEYLESDLEMIIKDKSILFMPGDVKHWMLMTLRGLDHCHRNWILHRVSTLQLCRDYCTFWGSVKGISIPCYSWNVTDHSILS